MCVFSTDDTKCTETHSCARVDSGTSSIGLTYIYNINSGNHENIALMVASMTATEQKKRDLFPYVEGML